MHSAEEYHVLNCSYPVLFFENFWWSFTLGGEFRAEIVSYDGNQSCLDSSLSFRATASRNETTVIVPINQFHCTLYQVSLLDTFWLRIVCGCIYHMLLANLHVLENLTVIPVSLLTTLHTCRQLPTNIQWYIGNPKMFSFGIIVCQVCIPSHLH